MPAPKDPIRRAEWQRNLSRAWDLRRARLTESDRKEMTAAACAKPQSRETRSKASKRVWAAIPKSERIDRVSPMREACAQPDAEARRVAGINASWTEERRERERPHLKAIRTLVSPEALSRAGKLLWVKLTPEERAAKLQNLLEHPPDQSVLAEAQRKAWAALSKDARAQRISRASVGASNGGHASWSNRSDEERLRHMDTMRTARREWWDQLSNEERDNYLTPILARAHAVPWSEARREGSRQTAIALHRRRGRTSIERTTAELLSALGITFEPQYRIGRFVVDFYVPTSNLVIECDGTYWHSRPGDAERDARRDAWLSQHGYRVCRLKEIEIGTLSTSELAERLAC